MLAVSMLVVGVWLPRGPAVASLEDTLAAFEGAAAAAEGEHALILHITHAEFLELAGDHARAVESYTRVTRLDPDGSWGTQARTALSRD